MGPQVQSRAAALLGPGLLGPTVLSAVVDPTGTLVRGKHAISARKADIPNGGYEVIFDRDVRSGAYVASVGKSDAIGVSQPGEITVVGRVSDTRGVYITTHDSQGVFSDRGFHLVVVCPEAGA